MTNISKNFTTIELIGSETARKHNIMNTPTDEEFQRLVKLVTTVLQPIRDKYGKTIYISSGFRNSELNRLVGGSKTSQHLRGEAADIHTVSNTKEDNKALFDLIAKMVQDGDIKVGQLIDEYDYKWIHVSTPYTKTNQILHLK